MSDNDSISVAMDDSDSDEEPVAESAIGSAFVTDTDWTLETLLSQLRRKNIQLNPKFQRRDAWDDTRKSRFIESLILGLPIPQIVLAEDKQKKGSFIVLDGKQRLLSLWLFAQGSTFGVYGITTPIMSLKGLDVRTDLVGATLKSLEEDPDAAGDFNSLINQTIRTVVVRNWPNGDFLNLVFLRLNTGSVSLSPQELRQALHPGPFTDYIDDFASDSDQVRRALRNSRADFRMRDVEIVLRYFAFKTRLHTYRGSLKHFLDETADQLNIAWENGGEEDLKGLAAKLDNSIAATFKIFETHSFFRWNPDRKRFERRFNRAIFDVMTYYFDDASVVDASLATKDEVVSAFVKLCEDDPVFSSSIQATTKSLEATHTRLSAWGRALSEAIDIPLDIPTLGPDRTIRP
ncbi:DUF262 domain-containing protein [Williamsia muralis]|uniref:DUF262 domain-containing protein n=1 Tax=Williamsia marianensis TaxID=85044 RepID=UPI00382BC71F